MHCSPLKKHEGVQHHAAPNRGNHMRTAAKKITEIKVTTSATQSAAVLTVPSVEETTVKLGEKMKLNLNVL